MNSITRGLDRVELKFPKLLLLESELLPFNDMVPTSKRAELVTLYIDQLNFTNCRSVTGQVLETPVSMLKVPGPRRPFRSPASPGKAGRNRLMAAFEFEESVIPGSLKTFGPVPPLAWFTIKLPV